MSSLYHIYYMCNRKTATRNDTINNERNTMPRKTVQRYSVTNVIIKHLFMCNSAITCKCTRPQFGSACNYPINLLFNGTVGIGYAKFVNKLLMIFGHLFQQY